MFIVYLQVYTTPQPRHSLITRYFPELSEEERKQLVLQWFPEKETSAAKKRVFSASYLGAVLGQLEGEQDGREFEALKTQFDEEKRIEFIVSRVGWSRSKAAHFTPKRVKELRPPNTVLTWQPASYSFQGYFPIPEALRTGAAAKGKAKADAKGKAKARAKRVQTHWARSRNYKAKRSKLEALTWIVDWLWKTHEQHGGVASAVHFLVSPFIFPKMCGFVFQS